MDKEPEYCAIDTPSWITDKLGKPLQDAPDIDDWACNHTQEILDYIQSREGIEYTEASRDNVYNHENSFSDIFVYTIYAPKDCSDYLYADDVYVAIEMHRGGDARGNYGGYKLYKADDLADAGFFDWVLGWYVTRNGENVDDTGRYGVGYSSNPTWELIRAMKNEKLLWSEKRKHFVGWLNGQAVEAMPCEY